MLLLPAAADAVDDDDHDADVAAAVVLLRCTYFACAVVYELHLKINEISTMMGRNRPHRP